MTARGDGGDEYSRLGMRLLVMPDGEAVVQLRGELDSGGAELAFGYIADVIDDGLGPVVVDLSEVRCCDTSGLRALARMCDYARHSGTGFQLAAPREPLAHVMRSSGLDLSISVF